MAKIRKIDVEATYQLRHEILRPHQAMAQCHYPGDMDLMTAHFGAFDLDEIVGIVSIYQVQNSQLDISNSWQLRAMATKEKVRGQGFGFKLLNAAESYALDLGGKCVWANARLNAVAFYEKSGYSVQGDEFDISNIGWHYLVYKKLI